MKYIVDNDLHIHSTLSACSNDPEQSTKNILEYAKRNKLKTICLTDHFWDSAVEGASGWYKPQDFEHISAAKPLPQADGIEFLFGCEAEMDKLFRVGISREVIDEFDFIIVPTTHLHMMGFTITKEDDSYEKRAELWVKRFDALLDSDLPFHKVGVAHLTCSLVAPTREEFLEVIKLIPPEEMQRLFKKAAEKGLGIELNSASFGLLNEENADLILRPYKIAKECGCKFYCASDAHHPENFDNFKLVLEDIVDRLGLTEDDKFHIAK